MALVKEDLQRIESILPAQHLDVLCGTRFYLNKSATIFENGKKALGRGLCYHESEEWLVEHGNISEKARHIECYSAEDFCNWHDIQPMMLLHELSHALHYKINDQRKDVLRAFDSAIKSKIYESVPYGPGGNARHYCLTNHLEYFAECSEAYWGRNDFFPFVRSELEKYDSIGFQLMEKIWNLNKEELNIELQKAVKWKKRAMLSSRSFNRANRFQRKVSRQK
jgi:hypothetical protein